MKLLAIIGALGAALIIPGCASGNLTTVDPPPANYRQLARDHVRANFLDPYSVRDAEIAAPRPSGGPVLVSTGLKEVWVVCVRANAKNSFGAYTGINATAILVHGNQVVDAYDNAAWSSFCAGAQYESFPEVAQGA